MLAIPRLIKLWYPLLIIIMLFLLTDSPEKLQLEKIHVTLIIFFYGNPSSPQLQRICFLIKNTKKQPLFSNWWEYTKSCLKENARALRTNFTTQEDIRISRLKKRLLSLYKEENFNQKLKQWLKTYKMNFIY